MASYQVSRLSSCCQAAACLLWQHAQRCGHNLRPTFSAGAPTYRLQPSRPSRGDVNVWARWRLWNTNTGPSRHFTCTSSALSTCERSAPAAPPFRPRKGGTCNLARAGRDISYAL